MFQDTPAWRAHVRTRMRTNAHLYIRHDAWRFMPPGSPRYVGKDVVRYFWPDAAKDRPVYGNEPEEFSGPLDLAAERKILSEIRYELAKLKYELAYRRILHSLKYGYNPNQPRVPAGSREGGQWTSGGVGQASSGGRSVKPERIRLAGEPPINDPPPEIPKTRPPTTQERNVIARAVATYLSRYGGTFGRLAAGAYWLYEEYPRIKAYQDPPKSLQELQEAVSSPQKGYDIHHIVEQTSAEQDGFSRSQIDAFENLVRIPTYKHWEITAWYQTKNREYGDMSPRDYLRGKDWEERRKIGLDTLIKFGVLKR
jgi:hypothetical protein